MADLVKIQEAKNRYLQEKVERLSIVVPKGEKQKMQEFAKSQGKSLNAFVVDLIHNAMEPDKG